jgi:hypothetical protein
MGIRTESDGTVPPQGLDVRTALRALWEAADDTNARLFSVIMLSVCGSVVAGVTSFFFLIHFSLSETHSLGEYFKREFSGRNQSDDTGGENVWSVHATTPNVDLLLGFPKAGVLLRNVTCSQMRQNCSRKPCSTPQKGSTLSESRSPELM